jgi:hypothetical protein
VIKMRDRLTTELATLDRDLNRLVAAAVPTLCALNGVGTDVAGAVLVAAGDNPERLRSEGAFANPWGVAPLPSRMTARQGLPTAVPRSLSKQVALTSRDRRTRHSDPKECEVRAHEKRGEFRIVQIESGGCRRARTLHLAVSLGTTPCPPPEVRS